MQDVSLTPKALSTLLVLVEHAGQVVSRETLRDQVWGEAFVEDAALTRHISILRATLAEYLPEGEGIETLSKRGYRFTAAVTQVEEEPVSLLNEGAIAERTPIGNTEGLPVATGAEADLAGSESIASGAGRARPWYPALLGTVALVLVLGLLFGLWRLRAARQAATLPAEAASVALVDLRDAGGGDNTAWMGVAVSESLAQDLSRDGGAAVASGSAVFTARRDLGLANAHVLQTPDLLAFGRRLHVRYLVTGMVLAVNESVRLDLHLVDAGTGNTVCEWSDTVAKPDLAAAVSRSANALRGAMHLAPAPAQQASLLTRDETALRLYAEGMTLMHSDEHRDQAAVVLRKAVEADPQSLEIRAALTQALSKSGDVAGARQQGALVLAQAKGLPQSELLPLKAAMTYAIGDYRGAAVQYAGLTAAYPQNRAYTLRYIDALVKGMQSSEAGASLRRAEANDASWSSDPDFLMLKVQLDVQNRDFRSTLVDAGLARKMAQGRGSRAGEAAALRASGLAWGGLGDATRALADLASAEAIYRETGNTILVLAAEADRETVMSNEGLPGLEAAATRTLAEARAAGSPFFVISSLQFLGNSSMTANKLPAAVAYFQAASDAAVAAQLPSMAISPLSNAATISLDLQDYAEAAKLNEAMFELADKYQDYASTAYGKLTECDLDLVAGKLGAAEADARAATGFYNKAGFVLRLSGARLKLAAVLLLRGDLAGAQAVYKEVDPSVNKPFTQPRWQFVGAGLALADGDAGKAETLGAAAMQASPATVPPSWQAQTLELTGRAQLAGGKLEAARATALRLAGLAKADPRDRLAAFASERLEARVSLSAGNLSGPALDRLPVTIRQAQTAKLPIEGLRLELVGAEWLARKGDGGSALRKLQAEASAQDAGLIALEAERAQKAAGPGAPRP